jgi:hypothetical protein
MPAIKIMRVLEGSGMQTNTLKLSISNPTAVVFALIAVI